MVLQSRVEQPDWYGGESGKNRAICATFPLPTKHDTDKDAWFHDERQAAHVCNGTFTGRVCPLREKCLEIALINNDTHGVWGGFLSEQRGWIRKQRRADAPNRISPSDWADSESWRHKVPSIDVLEEVSGASKEDEEE